MRRLLLAGILCAALAGPSLADPAITAVPSAMRHSPSLHSRVVQTIPANAQIDLQSCTSGWCYASWRDRFGYIPSVAVAQGAPSVAMAAMPPPVVVAPPPVVVAPAWSWGGPYVGFGYGWGWHSW